MDKTALVNYLKTLQLDGRAKAFLIDHVEKSNLDQALLDRVADVVELIADRSDIEGDLYAGLATGLEELKGKGEMAQDKYQAESDRIFEEFLTKAESAMSQKQDQDQLGQVRQQMTDLSQPQV